MMAEFITKEEALRAAHEGAFTIEQTGWDMDMNPVPDDAGRRIIHCFLGGMGAAWDLEGVVALIEEADQCGWVDDIFDHNLAVAADGKVYRFGITKPVDEPK